MSMIYSWASLLISVPAAWPSYGSKLGLEIDGMMRKAVSVLTQSVLLLRQADLLAKRSEEHTSELQSRLHLVCRLLLEKKNVRPEGGSGHLLRRHRPDPADARPDGTPRGSPTGAVRLRPDPEHGGREGAPGPRPGRHGRERLRHRGGGRSGEERGDRGQAGDDVALRTVVHLPCARAARA